MGGHQRDAIQAPQADSAAAPAATGLPGRAGVELASAIGNRAFTGLVGGSPGLPAMGALSTAGAQALLRQGAPATAPSPPAAPAAGGQPQPAAQPAPPKPSAVELDPAFIREQVLTRLRDRAILGMSLSFGKFIEACRQVKEDEAKRKAEPTLLSQLLEIAVGTLAPGLAGAAVKAVRGVLSEVAAKVVEKAVKDRNLQVDVYMAADKWIEDHVKLDESGAKSALGFIKGRFAGEPAGAAPKTQPGEGDIWDAPNAPGGVGGDTAKHTPGGAATVSSLIAQFLQTYSQQLEGIGKLATELNDPGQLASLVAMFDQGKVTQQGYAAQIRSLVRMHEELVEAAGDDSAGVGGSAFDHKRIVNLEAWGQTKPAIIAYRPGSMAAWRRGYWYFVKWVSSTMENTATALGGAQKGGLEHVRAGEPYPPGYALSILGHIDHPKEEGERIVRVDMYGRVRPCRVRITAGRATFISWITRGDDKYDESASARMEEQAQGGPQSFDPSKFDGHVPAPPPNAL